MHSFGVRSTQINGGEVDKMQVLRCFTVMNDALGEWDNSNLRKLNFVNCHVRYFLLYFTLNPS